MEILQKKISKNHNDSLFYNGEIAKIGDWYLVAVGEIEIKDRWGRIVYARGEKYSDDIEFKNDDDICNMVDFDDVDLGMRWEHNNWFEVINFITGEGGLGFVAHTYDEGIELLKETAKGE